LTRILNPSSDLIGLKNKIIGALFIKTFSSTTQGESVETSNLREKLLKLILEIVR